MATTSPVKIPVTADPTRALKAFSAVQRSMAKLAPIAAKTAVRVTKIGVAFGATATAATVALTKMSMSSIDNLAKTADKIGTTTESLAGLRHAAEQTGVSSNTRHGNAEAHETSLRSRQRNGVKRKQLPSSWAPMLKTSRNYPSTHRWRRSRPRWWR